MHWIHRAEWADGLMVEAPAPRRPHRRLPAVLLLLAGGYTVHRINQFDGCELVGHDAHWETPTLRVCRRCPMTWRRDVGDIAATTTNQPAGW